MRFGSSAWQKMVTMWLGRLPGQDSYSFHKDFSSFVVSFLEFWSSGGDPFLLSCVCGSFSSKERLFARNVANKAPQLQRPEKDSPTSHTSITFRAICLLKPVLGRVQRSRETPLAEVVPKRSFFDQARKGLDQNTWRLVQAGVFSCLVRRKWGTRVCKSSHRQDGKKGKALLWAGLRKPNGIGNVSHRWLGHSKRHLMLWCQRCDTRALCSGPHTKHQLVIGVFPQGSAPKWPSERDLAEGSHPSVKSEGHGAAWRSKTELVQHQLITSWWHCLA